MPSLQTLPLELRQKIYTLAFASPGTTKIAAHTRHGVLDCQSEELALSVAEDGKTHRTTHHDTSLIRVNKEVSADALSMLYGCYHFTFQNSKALELFLVQIGAMKQHLRHISIAIGGYEHDFDDDRYGIYSATKRSISMLAVATGLETFTISHYDFCCGGYSFWPDSHFSDFQRTCAQLLQGIIDTRSAQGLKVNIASMLDVVKIELPECAGCFACNKSGVQLTSTRRGFSYKEGIVTKRFRCRCKCREAERSNEVMMEKLKSSITDLLHLR